MTMIQKLLGGLTFIALSSACSEPERAPRAVPGGNESSESSDGSEVELELDQVLAETLDYTTRLQQMGAVSEQFETHADAASVRVWASPSAVDLFNSINPNDPSQAVAFQPGTVFVKEHFDAAGAMFGLNIMYKGPSGYAPEDGDWYWIQRRGDQVTRFGQVEFCLDCHGAAINSDFVVGFGKSQ